MIYFQKAIFLKGVRSQVERVAGEPKRMQYFLNDAQARQNGDERVGNWVSKIQNAAYIYKGRYNRHDLHLQEVLDR